MSKFKLDEVDHQILDILIDNKRTPFTDIAKKLLISAGTVHVRVKKMEDGIIKGSSLTLIRYTFIVMLEFFFKILLKQKFLKNYIIYQMLLLLILRLVNSIYFVK